MKILLLGGAGRLGFAMQRLFVQHIIIAPSHAELDVLDAEAFSRCVEDVAPECIINCIAYNNVDEAERIGRENAFRLNTQTPGAIARCAAERQIPLIHFSSDYVFEGTQEQGYLETDAAHPRSVYGESKLRGEEAVLTNHSTSYVIRTSRLFGQFGDSASGKKSFVELIIADAEKAARVLVNREERSAPTYVDDLVQHLESEILSQWPEPGIYHMANAGGATWLEWAREIGRVLDLPTQFAPREAASLRRPAARPAHSLLRSLKIPQMRSWQEALVSYLDSQAIQFQQKWISLGIEGVAIEPQPRIGEPDGAVVHLLPGGTKNPHGFGQDILDIYAFTAKGQDKVRGGHYHLKLDELFFPMSGTALWILSDFRQESSTRGKTIGVILGIEPPMETHGLPCYVLSQGTLPRLRVPAGVYHAIFPLTSERVMTTAIGSTPYDKEDYRYPTIDEVPGMKAMLEKFTTTE